MITVFRNNKNGRLYTMFIRCPAGTKKCGYIDTVKDVITGEEHDLKPFSKIWARRNFVPEFNVNLKTAGYKI